MGFVFLFFIPLFVLYGNKWTCSFSQNLSILLIVTLVINKKHTLHSSDFQLTMEEKKSWITGQNFLTAEKTFLQDSHGCLVISNKWIGTAYLEHFLPRKVIGWWRVGEKQVPSLFSDQEIPLLWSNVTSVNTLFSVVLRRMKDRELSLCIEHDTPHHFVFE